ncbi:MAG: hypothetical protein GY769_08200 [bacterium]|nr:hypothetical protein [bacterium]
MPDLRSKRHPSKGDTERVLPVEDEAGLAKGLKVTLGIAWVEQGLGEDVVSEAKLKLAEMS